MITHGGHPPTPCGIINPMPDMHQMTAEAHLSYAERLLSQAEPLGASSEHDIALATVHLDCARTIVTMQEAERNRQSRLDAKSQMAGLSDILTRAMPASDDDL